MPDSRPREDATDGRVSVWDLAVRMSHGLLALCVLFDLVRDDGDQLHRTVGYVAVGVVAARLLWAAWARGHGGWAALMPSVSQTTRYLRSGAPRTIGHDPVGLWMVWLLWLLVLLLGLTGWVSRLDAFWGDERVTDLHGAIANVLLVCVALHLAGVALMSWRWRENLPGAMLTGRKRGER